MPRNLIRFNQDSNQASAHCAEAKRPPGRHVWEPLSKQCNIRSPLLYYNRFLDDLLVMASTTSFTSPPPSAKYAILSFPTPEILLVTLNRPNQLNCINIDGNIELDAIWSWMDAEPTLRVGIITGAGRAFCAGADLKGGQAIPIFVFNITQVMTLKNYDFICRLCTTNASISPFTFCR